LIFTAHIVRMNITFFHSLPNEVKPHSDMLASIMENWVLHQG
jgi:hypothetical protein